jgi:hypothetical protein
LFLDGHPVLAQQPGAETAAKPATAAEVSAELKKLKFRPFTLGQKITLSGAYIFNSAAASKAIVGYAVPGSKLAENPRLTSDLKDAAQQGRVYVASGPEGKQTWKPASPETPPSPTDMFVVTGLETEGASVFAAHSTGKVISWGAATGPSADIDGKPPE